MSPAILRFRVLLSALLVCGAGPQDALARQALPVPGSYRVVVGPEIRISRDAHRPHTELVVAANPLDVNNLIVASMTAGGRSGGFSATVFASHDGGHTWTSFEPPRLQQAGGSDPLIAFGPAGTAYFIVGVEALTWPPRPADRYGYDLYRSMDGGTTWALAQTQAASGDHPWAAVDLTRGPYRGTLYLIAAGRVFRSSDDGRTMRDTFTLTPGLVQNAGIMVLGDGSLVVALSPDEGARGEGGRQVATVTSSDGGRTWGSPAVIPRLVPQEAARRDASRRGIRPVDLSLGVGSRSFAADTTGRSRCRGRIYAAWTDLQGSRSRIMVSASSDRGRSWTDPVAVSADSNGFQFLPTIATNSAGLLGVLYGDSRGFRADEGRFHAYFAASIDCGGSFLEPRRLSSRPSTIETTESGRPMVNHAWPYADSVSVWFSSLLVKHPTGGDYLGLAADIEGVFHPVWADSRSGVYQAYTSRVAVLPEGRLARAETRLSAPVSVSDRVTVEVDPIGFDSATLVATMPMRLRNLSPDTVWGPIEVRVRAIAYRGMAPDESSTWRVLNAENDLDGVGARFDYTPSLGDAGLLPPGGVSSPIDWLARFPQLRDRYVRLQLDVLGRLRQ